MTPAETTDQQIYADFLFLIREGSTDGAIWGPWSPSFTADELTGWLVKQRPASVSNPVRNDGTRPPSGWYHRWSSSAFSSREVAWIEPRPWALYESRCKAIPLSTALHPALGASGLYEALGAAWLADSGEFPYEAEARARTKFLGQVADGVADLGVALGELKQTVDLTRQLAESTLSAIDRCVKAGRGLPKWVIRNILEFGSIPAKLAAESSRAWRKRVARERAVLNTWLQFQFGIRPLVSDIYNIGQGLSDMLFEQAVPLKLTLKAGGYQKARKTSYLEGIYGTPKMSLVLQGTTKNYCHISGTYLVPLSGTRTMNQWGVANPANVVWELTAWSWLIDYQIQVGNWLQSLTADYGITFLEGTISRKQLLTQALSRIQANPLYPNPIRILDGGEWMDLNPSAGKMTREVVSDIYPAYRPAVRNRLNLTRLANALSAVAQGARLH